MRVMYRVAAPEGHGSSPVGGPPCAALPRGRAHAFGGDGLYVAYRKVSVSRCAQSERTPPGGPIARRTGTPLQV